MSELVTSDVIRKLKRLGAMRPRELAHRFREKVYSELDRVSLQARGAGGVPSGSACQPNFKNYLTGAAAGRFYRSHSDNLRPFVERRFPQWIDRAVDEAE